ncbi:signal peptidase I [Acidithiobacillus sp. MC6.1]|nr:signal peptidase I [Acidithiobacillus sp. MC6.1]
MKAGTTRDERNRFYRRLLGAALLSFVILFPLIDSGAAAVRRDFGVAYSPQAVSCLPWTWYLERISPPRRLREGDIVMAKTHKAFGDVPIGKLVIGLPGDHVVETRRGIWVNGHFWGRMWLLHWLEMTHKRAPDLPKQYVIPQGHVLLLGTDSQSLDGRYWGMVRDRNITGSMLPL